jgi:hypothetical protein
MEEKGGMVSFDDKEQQVFWRDCLLKRNTHNYGVLE